MHSQRTQYVNYILLVYSEENHTRITHSIYVSCFPFRHLFAGDMGLLLHLWPGLMAYWWDQRSGCPCSARAITGCLVKLENNESVRVANLREFHDCRNECNWATGDLFYNKCDLFSNLPFKKIGWDKFRTLSFRGMNPDLVDWWYRFYLHAYCIFENLCKFQINYLKKGLKCCLNM